MARRAIIVACINRDYKAPKGPNIAVSRRYCKGPSGPIIVPTITAVALLLL